MKHAYKHYRGRDRQTLQAILRDKGFRSTEGRLKLLSILKSVKKPLSVSEVVGRIGSNLDEVNVYRALDALSSRGIFVRRDLRQRGVSYEYSHSHHHHLICDNCGEKEDVEYCSAQDMERKILKNSRQFRLINTHSLEFFGVFN